MKLNILFKKIIFSVVVVFLLSGCVARIWGSYVGQPKEGGDGRYSSSFNCSYEDCFQETEAILESIGAELFSKSKKKGFISAIYFGSVYKNYVDTTEVGIFFKEVESGKIQIDVACGNIGLAEAASKKIFSELNKKY